MTPQEFTMMVARLTKEGELIEGKEMEWSNDDAWETLHSLITQARLVVVESKP